MQLLNDGVRRVPKMRIPILRVQLSIRALDILETQHGTNTQKSQTSPALHPKFPHQANEIAVQLQKNVFMNNTESKHFPDHSFECESPLRITVAQRNTPHRSSAQRKTDIQDLLVRGGYPHHRQPTVGSWHEEACGAAKDAANTAVDAEPPSGRRGEVSGAF